MQTNRAGQGGFFVTHFLVAPSYPAFLRGE